MDIKKIGLLIFSILCVVLIVVPGQAYHIPTVDEGLLTTDGCFIGAYLGGNQGVDGPNYYQSARPDKSPYETQILDPGISYGQINTGIDTFRAAAGDQHIIFSRYVDLSTAPYDDNYEKKQYVRSPTMAEWAEDVIKKGGVPMIVLDPWAFTNSQGILDLSSNGAYPGDGFGNGNQHIIKFAEQLDAVSKKYPDNNGKYATILIVFGQEFESHNEANPPSDANTNGPHQQAFRSMFREAYTLFHDHANENIQLVWSGNVADTWESKKWWWPQYDDNMVEHPDWNCVDWVGQTRYHWAMDQKLSDMTDYYQHYSVNKSKPFIFTETSADGGGDESKQLALEQDWIPKLYNVSVLYPDFMNIKGIVWFNVAKHEDGLDKNFLLPDGAWVDNGLATPGEVKSQSDASKMMEDLYPNATNLSYFTHPPPDYLPGGESSFYADFVAEPLQGDAPLTVQFTSQSSGNPIQYLYDFGDGVTSRSKNPAHTYLVPGDYTVTLKIWRIVGSTLVETSTVKENLIKVSGEPVPILSANFTAEPLQGDAPFSVQFTDTSTGNPMKWKYDFGDGTSSTARNPVYVYRVPGIYDVSLTVFAIDGSRLVSDTTVKVDLVTVEGTPVPGLVANFTAAPFSGTAPLSVQFTDTSTGNPKFWKYDFGDGFTSSSQNPEHIYRRPGTYTVKLTVTGFGPGYTLISDSTTRQDLVVVQ
jgi:PKD repeat protein